MMRNNNQHVTQAQAHTTSNADANDADSCLVTAEVPDSETLTQA